MKLKKTGKIIILLVIIAIVLLTIILFSKKDKPNEEENATANSEFENLQVKDLEVKYNKEIDQTIITYKIQNITDEQIAGETINVLGLDESETVVIASQIYISLEGKGEYNGEVTVVGNITDSIKDLKLEKPEISEPDTTDGQSEE